MEHENVSLVFDIMGLKAGEATWTVAGEKIWLGVDTKYDRAVN